jgi:hypothetical protein
MSHKKKNKNQNEVITVRTCGEGAEPAEVKHSVNMTGLKAWANTHDALNCNAEVAEHTFRL